MWEVLFHAEYVPEFDALDVEVQRAIFGRINLLRATGPNLGRPYVDTVKGSRFPNMKELRVVHRGRPWRVLFAFDPSRRAVLLVGGDKAGDDRWYETAITVADERYGRHLGG